MPGWNDMTCMERTVKIVMVLAFVILFIALALNCYVIYLSTSDTWFTKCSDCKSPVTSPPAGGNGTPAATASGGGTKNCVKCCKDCNLKDEVFFYIMRGYNMLFILVGLVAELRIPIFYDYAKVCAFYLPRGFFHIFIGLMTVTSTLPDPQGAIFADIVGYAVVAIGVIHFLLGLLCFGEYSEEGRNKEYEMQAKRGTATGGAAGSPASTASPASGGGGEAYQYKYGGQTYSYNGSSAGATAI
jgi:hypothetical protein